MALESPDAREHRLHAEALQEALDDSNREHKKCQELVTQLRSENERMANREAMFEEARAKDLENLNDVNSKLVNAQEATFKLQRQIESQASTIQDYRTTIDRLRRELIRVRPYKIRAERWKAVAEEKAKELEELRRQVDNLQRINWQLRRRTPTQWSGVDREEEKAELESWPRKLLEIRLSERREHEESRMADMVNELNEAVRVVARNVRKIYELHPEWFPGVDDGDFSKLGDKSPDEEDFDERCDDVGIPGLDYPDE